MENTNIDVQMFYNEDGQNNNNDKGLDPDTTPPVGAANRSQGGKSIQRDAEVAGRRYTARRCGF